jgi:hypothetical protein
VYIYGNLSESDTQMPMYSYEHYRQVRILVRAASLNATLFANILCMNRRVPAVLAIMLAPFSSIASFFKGRTPQFLQDRCVISMAMFYYSRRHDSLVRNQTFFTDPQRSAPILVHLVSIVVAFIVAS